MVELKIRCQKNDQLGAGQMARVVAVPTWKGACPVRLMSDRLWFRPWLSRRRGRENRMSMPPGEALLFVGLARARFGFGAPLAITSAGGKKGFDGRHLSPRKGGARLYVVTGMAREATQVLGGWKSPAVMEGVYTKARSEEVAPEMHPAIAKACTVLEVTSFAEDLDRDVCANGDEAVGLEFGYAGFVCRASPLCWWYFCRFVIICGRRRVVVFVHSTCQIHRSGRRFCGPRIFARR